VSGGTLERGSTAGPPFGIERTTQSEVRTSLAAILLLPLAGCGGDEGTATSTGIEPEEIDYTTMKVTYGGHPLRPEIIESAYYLFVFTKDERYREMGRVYLDGLVLHCRTDAGYAALKDVQTKEKRDNMESFFLAETLKYLYLLFAPPETIDLSTTVFNTEARWTLQSFVARIGFEQSRAQLTASSSRRTSSSRWCVSSSPRHACLTCAGDDTIECSR
jgi:hypothetical protein